MSKSVLFFSLIFFLNMSALQTPPNSAVTQRAAQKVATVMLKGNVRPGVVNTLQQVIKRKRKTDPELYIKVTTVTVNQK